MKIKHFKAWLYCIEFKKKRGLPHAHTVPKSKLYLYTFLPLYFRTLSQIQTLSLYIFTIIFPYTVPNPNFISIHFYHYISAHCPKSKLYLYTFLPLYFRTLSQIQTLSLYIFTIIFPHTRPKIQTISLYIFTIIFPHTVPNPNFISIHFYHYISAHPSQNPNYIYIHFYHYISVHCPKIQTISLYIFTIIFPHTVPKSKLYLYTFLPLYFRTLSQIQAKPGIPVSSLISAMIPPFIFDTPDSVQNYRKHFHTM